MKSGVCEIQESAGGTSSRVTVREDFQNEKIHELVRSKVKDVVSKSPGFVCELVADL
jgi:hypothetical protein